MISEALEDGVSIDDPEYGRFFNEWLDARSEDLRIGVSTRTIDMWYEVRQKISIHALNAKCLIRRLRSI